MPAPDGSTLISIGTAGTGYYAPDGSIRATVTGTLGGLDKIAVGTDTPLYPVDIRTPASTQFHIASTDTDTGGYLFGLGDNMYMTSGFEYNGSAWTAKATSSSGIRLNAAGITQFYSDTGLTSGDPMSPTIRANIGPTSATFFVPVTTPTSVTDHTTTYSLISGTLNGIQTNVGSSGTITANLPTAAVGTGPFTFYCNGTNSHSIKAGPGDTIRVGPSVSAAAGTCAATTQGNTVTLVCINATEWIATSVIGTWTLT